LAFWSLTGLISFIFLWPEVSSARPAPPEARTAAAVGAFPHEAVMSAFINPRGWPTRFRFEYGRTTEYGASTEASEEVIDGHRWLHVAEGLCCDLPSKTTFHYRVIAFNRFGSDHGQDRTFTTSGRPKPPPPGARTTAAIGIHGDEAVVTGIVDPRGQATRYRFQYGRTESYGQVTDASEELVVGHGDRKVAAALFRLEPKTTYHFRIVAFNRLGSVFGQDRTFRTTRR
jgi:phosphodiesterase/alkaline phosphatase D-like protein